MATEVEILGHKAKIDRVRGQTKLQPWYKEDQLVVWLEFDEAVDSILSFGVPLPVKKYTQEEFLYQVCRRGAEELRRILAKNEVVRKGRQEEKERQAAVDAAAAEAQRLLE